MQLTVADPAVDHVDLVLEAWSAAPAAQLPVTAPDPSDAADVDELVAQLSLRLEDGQIPLWDARA